MTIAEIKEMKWNKVDWGRVSFLDRNDYGYITAAAVDLFLEGLYNSLARDLKISEKKAQKVIQDNNKEFFNLKEKIFYSKHSDCKVGSPAYKELQNSLRVPDTEFHFVVTRIEKMLKQYKELSPFERIEFNSMVDDFEMSIKEKE